MKYFYPTLALILCNFAAMQNSWAGSDKEALALTKSIIDKSGFSAQASIKKVQKLYPGIVYDYELDEDDDVYYHEIKLIDIEADNKVKVTISIEDGTVVKTEVSKQFSWFTKLFSWFLEDERMAKIKKLAEADYSILTGMDTIKLAKDSLVTDVELEEKQGVLYFELETFGPEGEKEWLVDVNSNQLIPVFHR